MDSPNTSHVPFLSAMLMGAIIGLGQLALSGDPITWRLAFGRAVVTAGLACAGFSVLTFIPQLSVMGQLGVAAMIASLGTSAAEKLLARFVGGKKEAE